MTPLVGVLRSEQDRKVAARLLEEAKTPPNTAHGRAAFRHRWLPWLLGHDPGPVTPPAVEIPSGANAMAYLLPQQP